MEDSTKNTVIYTFLVIITISAVAISPILYFVGDDDGKDKTPGVTANPQPTPPINQQQPPTSPPPAAFEDYQELALKLHNQYRKDHHARPLSLSEDLIKAAEACAKHYLNQGRIDGSCRARGIYYGSPVGESAYQGPRPGMMENDVVEKGMKQWYQENVMHDFTLPQPLQLSWVEHFTQIVWQSTRHLGVSVQRNGNDAIFVAIYYPAGNIANNFKLNVRPV